MDKFYKPLFFQIVKEGMAQLLPGFSQVKVVRGQPNADVFAGALLYCFVAQPRHTVWVWWQPGSHDEPRFFVFVGWSPSRGTLPIHDEHDRRIYSLLSPTQDFPSCSLSLEQVLGRSAIGGFEIPTPWDQVYKLKPNTPSAEQKRVVHKAATEVAALAAEDRMAAVRGVTDEVFSHLLSVVPSFHAPAGRSSG